VGYRSLLGHVLEVDTGFFEEFGQLTGREDVIHVGTVVFGELVPGSFIFLGHTGHDGNHHHVFFFYPDLLSVVVLGDGAKHLLGRLGCGRHAQKVWELVFEELHPTRTAGGEDGKVLPAFDPLNELGSSPP
jgi:hypothetical protein